jgi:hypothetical protein
MKRQLAFFYLAGLAGFIAVNLLSPAAHTASAMEQFNRAADELTTILVSSNANQGMLAVTRMCFGGGLAVAALMSVMVLMGF